MSRQGQLAIYTTHMGNIQGGGFFQVPHTKNPYTQQDIIEMKTKKPSKGGNPAMISALASSAPAIASAIGSIAKPASDAIKYIDNAGDRIVKKGQLTGKYDRIDARNDRFAGRKNLANDLNMAKKIIAIYKKEGVNLSIDDAFKIAQNY